MQSNVAILLAMVMVVGQAEDEIITKLKNAFETCRTKHPLTNTEVEAMKNAETDFQFSHDAKCFLACMLEVGDILKGGKFIKENAFILADILNRDNFDELEKSRKVIEYCSMEVPEDASDKCEYVYKLSMCWGIESKES